MIRHVLCAPDSFKGTLSASAVADALSRGILSAAPNASIEVIPMADGGEGTIDSIASIIQGCFRHCEVSSSMPSGAPQRARWYQTSDRLAVLEVSDTSGFASDTGLPADPEIATTYPVGETLLNVLGHGVSHVMIGLGGSRTVDGGLGLLQALGARMTVRGALLARPITGGDLLHLDAVDLGPLQARCEGIRIEVACDVTNPLTGHQGAARVYGPQKGADPEAVDRLEAGLKRLSGLLADPGRHEGDGAAGGAPRASVVLIAAA